MTPTRFPASRRRLAVALLALPLAACLADADLLAGAAVPAPDTSADCQWLRSTDQLDGRISVDWQHARADGAGGQWQRQHAADVRGTLRLLQRDARAAVWSGVLPRGRLRLDERHLQPDGRADRRLSGAGAPGQGPALAGTVVTLRVDFSDCSLQWAARLAVPATAQDGSTRRWQPAQEMGRLTVAGLSATGGPVLAGAWRVPAGAGAPLPDDGTQALGRYQPAGLQPGAGPADGSAGVAAGAPAGDALVRWLFKARA